MHFTLLETDWQQDLQKNIRTKSELVKFLGKLSFDTGLLNEQPGEFAINLSRSYVTGLVRSAKTDKQKSQIIKLLLSEFATENPDYLGDPLASLDSDTEETTGIKGLTHFYEDRALITPIFSCFHDCPWCFRGKENGGLSKTELNIIYDYIKMHPEITDVIITGGDPLLNSNNKINEILTRIREIEHVDIIRFHSRAPVVMPNRIDDELAGMLSKHSVKGKPVYFVTHIVHPLELSESATDSVEKLVQNGIMVFNQSPILHGVNDDEETFNELYKKLIKYKIKPYYLGLSLVDDERQHYFVKLKRAAELVNQYAAKYDGLGRPTLIVPISGKKIAVSELMDYMEKYGTHVRMTKNELL